MTFFSSISHQITLIFFIAFLFAPAQQLFQGFEHIDFCIVTRETTVTEQYTRRLFVSLVFTIFSVRSSVKHGHLTVWEQVSVLNDRVKLRFRDSPDNQLVQIDP